MPLVPNSVKEVDPREAFCNKAARPVVSADVEYAATGVAVVGKPPY